MLDVQVVVPVADMASLGETVEAPASAGAAVSPMRRSIWPAIHPRLLELVQSHRSTLIFANARRLSERLASRLNELHLEAQDNEDHSGPVRLVEGDRSGGPVRVGDVLSDLVRPGDATPPSDGGDPVGMAGGVPAVGDVSQVAPPVSAGDETVGTGAAVGTELVKAPPRVAVAPASPAHRRRAQAGRAAGPGGHLHP